MSTSIAVPYRGSVLALLRIAKIAQPIAAIGIRGNPVAAFRSKVVLAGTYVSLRVLPPRLELGRRTGM